MLILISISKKTEILTKNGFCWHFLSFTGKKKMLCIVDYNKLAKMHVIFLNALICYDTTRLIKMKFKPKFWTVNGKRFLPPSHYLGSLRNPTWIKVPSSGIPTKYYPTICKSITYDIKNNIPDIAPVEGLLGSLCRKLFYSSFGVRNIWYHSMVKGYFCKLIIPELFFHGIEAKIYLIL